MEAGFLSIELLDCVDYTGESEEVDSDKVQVELLIGCGFLHPIDSLCRFLSISSEDIHACSMESQVETGIVADSIAT